MEAELGGELLLQPGITCGCGFDPVSRGRAPSGVEVDQSPVLVEGDRIHIEGDAAGLIRSHVGFSP